MGVLSYKKTLNEGHILYDPHHPQRLDMTINGNHILRYDPQHKLKMGQTKKNTQKQTNSRAQFYIVADPKHIIGAYMYL